MNRHALLVTTTMLSGGLAAVLTGAAPSSGHVEPAAAASSAAAAGESTSTIMVVVDDMRADEMRSMTDTYGWLAGEGARFSHAYAPTPLCCPARATLLTGQYAHNTSVLDNNAGGQYPGGFENFDDRVTLATQLQDAGVTTGYVGKYLNGYGKPSADPEYVPPGWDSWSAGIEGEYTYKDSTTYNIDGRVVDRDGYETTVQTNMAVRFLNRHADEQFYLQVNYLAPHDNVTTDPRASRPPVPPPAHRHDYDGYTVPRTLAFNEEDVLDKPPNMQRTSLSDRGIASVDRTAEARLETLQGVDDAMMRLRRRAPATWSGGQHQRHVR